MNKNGFTLIEVIVSLALLSLIGVAVGISLNKIFKNQEIKSYNEYLEKVKSSAILFSNNTPDIMNELNSNYSYKVVTIKELVDKGYINKNLTNPETKEKINQEDSVRIYYNEDYEMMVDYPYKDEGEIYLYTMNYSIPYKSDEENLCYKGLDGPTLQLVKVNTNDAGSKYEGVSLISGTNIVAYMEDGSLCYDPKTKKSKIDTSKIGTYKIRYEYTIDGTDVRTSSNKKIAERTITVKPSKPKMINNFKVINNDSINTYKAQMSFKATDNVDMKYCVIAVKNGDTPSINSCAGESSTFKSYTWIKLNKEEQIKENINITDAFPQLIDEDEINIYLYIKNEFEEYIVQEGINENGSNIYKLTNTLIIHLDTNIEFNENTKFYKNDNINGVLNNPISKTIIIKGLKNSKPKASIKQATDGEKTLNKNFIPITPHYQFTGWYYDKSLSQKVNVSDEIKVPVLDIYAKWEQDDIVPTCTLSISNGKITPTFENNNILYSGWDQTYIGSNSSNNKIILGTTTFYIMDNALNKNSCSIDIKKTILKTHNICVNVGKCIGSQDCDPGGACCVYDYHSECHDENYLGCEDEKTYTKYDDTYCWKSIS